MAHLLGFLDEVETDNILAFNADQMPDNAGLEAATSYVPMPVMIGQGYMLQTEIVWFQDVSMKSLGVSGP